MPVLPDQTREAMPGLQSETIPLPRQAPSGAEPLSNGKFQLRPPALHANVGPFLANSLQKRWESYRQQLRRCQRGFSEETVHELRVATRRLIAQLVLTEFVVPGGKLQKARRILKRRLKALGKLRDLHVQRLFIGECATRYPELILVRDALQRTQRVLEKEVAANVKGFKTGKLKKWLSDAAWRLMLDPEQSYHSDRLARSVERAVTQAFAEVVKRRRGIKPTSASTIHRTRTAFKKFRYMVESLSPAFTGLIKRDLRALAQYQRRMGMIQDLELVQACIAEFIQHHTETEPLLQPFGRYLQRSRARKLRSLWTSVDDLFSFWPPTRSKPNGHTAPALDAT